MRKQARQTNNKAEYLNLVYKSNPDKLEIASGNLLPVIIKALQELSKENNNLTKGYMNLSDQHLLLLEQNNQLINEIHNLKLKVNSENLNV